METNTFHLHDSHQRELQKMVEIINRIVKAEAIVCYAVISKSLMRRNCFLEQGLSLLQTNTYYLLAVIADDDVHEPEHSLEYQLENKCAAIGDMVIAVHKSGMVKKALTNRSRFFCRALQTGIMVYKGILDAYCVPNDLNDPKHIRERQTFYRSKYGNAAKSFMAGAELYITSKDFTLALFMLHQVTESICMAAVRITMGYRMTTHNLNRHLRYVSCFDDKMAAILPNDTPEEKALFKTLNKAYSDARYLDDYTVSEVTCQTLTQQVKRLLNHFEEVYKPEMYNTIG